MKHNDYLWVEKYRPQTIDECILPKKFKDTFKAFVDNGEIPHLLLTGGPGVGKTTVAKALCNELGVDVLVINASENGNIDTLRTTIRQFASTVSLGGNGKVVILDEADYLNANSTQPALRNFMEEFSKNCRFILTANYANRIIEPLRSRCSVIDFHFDKNELQLIAAQFMKRVISILEKEGVEFDKRSLADVIKRFFPDFRKILNELQRYSVNGAIDSGIVDTLSDESISGLLKNLKNKEFTSMRKWVAEHSDYDMMEIVQMIRPQLEECLEPSNIPLLAITIYEFDAQLPFCTDKENALVAFFTTLMMEFEFGDCNV